MYHDEEVEVEVEVEVVKMDEWVVVHILRLEEDNYWKAERVEDHLVPENQARGEKEVKAADEIDLALEEAEQQQKVRCYSE